jgi:hypothetical protein
LLVGFTNFDWDGDPNNNKYTIGYVFNLVYGPITLACEKQQSLSIYL